jgi:DNA modification methylase
LLDKNLVYHGDCLEIMKNIDNQSIDMILCDLPYGTTQCKWDIIIPFEKLWEQYERIIKKNGAIVLFGGEPFSSLLRTSNLKLYKYDWKWDKITGTGHLCVKYQPLQRIEDIIVFAKNTPTYNPQMKKLDEQTTKKKIAKISKKKTCKSNSELTNARNELDINDRDISNYNYAYPDNLLSYSKYMQECNNVKRVHPTQKPVALFEYLIKTYTNEDNLVLDNCIGSGTTAIACLNTNRNFIGIEKELKYVQAANQRIQNILREG